MPDGYRRGGQYRTRSGATAYRRGTKIAAPKGLLVTAGALVAFTAITGGSLVGSPVLVGLVGLTLVGLLVHRYRRQFAPVGWRMLRWAEKRTTGSASRKTGPVTRGQKYEIFNPADGTTVRTVRGERKAVRVTENQPSLDYAPEGEGW
jgi:hypothetical protein